MSAEDNMKASSSEQQSLSCSMTFQNAIEIDYSKLREMAKQEALEKEDSTSKEGDNVAKDEDKVDDMTDQLSASILTPNTSTAHAGRDLSVYDRALESHDPDSSSDEEEEFHKSGHRRTDVEEEDTEVENSHSDEDEDPGAQYEQLGSMEFTKQHSQDEDDGDGALSDGEFGEFESCPVSYQMMSSEDHDSHHLTVDEDNHHAEVEVDEVQLEDKTQDVLGNYHPRTAATAIPPLDQDKIALIKNTMAGLKLKPLANAGELAFSC